MNKIFNLANKKIRNQSKQFNKDMHKVFRNENNINKIKRAAVYRNIMNNKEILVNPIFFVSFYLMLIYFGIRFLFEI